MGNAESGEKEGDQERRGGGGATEHVDQANRNQKEIAADPCDPILEAYINCAEGHQGVAPRAYEGEWCEGEKGLYIDCRRNWAKERRARLAHAVKVERKPWEKDVKE